jgi:hypothetical protein
VTDKTERRDFLKIVGAGLAGASLNAAPGLSQNHAPGKGSTGGGSGILNVHSFGATGNGSTIDSPAINKTIETAAAGGGGTVYFPAGNYLCIRFD